MASQKIAYLNAMGILPWRLRTTVQSTVNSWDSLENAVKTCQACDLCHTRTQTVFGVGDKHAKLMLIGEAPGFNEDKLGLPFVGKAGQLLDRMLFSIGLARENIFIANCIKCRPPNNRDPLPNEIQACNAFLIEQIEKVNPNLIVALGRIAGQTLLGCKQTIANMRGQIHQLHNNKPMIVTYHPAYLLRNPREKSKALSDLIRIRTILENQH